MDQSMHQFRFLYHRMLLGKDVESQQEYEFESEFVKSQRF